VTSHAAVSSFPVDSTLRTLEEAQGQIDRMEQAGAIEASE